MKGVARIANVKIIYGAPCSGKSTYVNDNITDNDIKFDFDEILSALSNSDLHDNREELLDYGMEIRGLVIEKAANDKNIDTAYIISCKITDKLLEQLGDIEAEYILIEKNKDEVLEQLENDDTREDKEHWKELIDDWFEWNEDYEAKQQINTKPKGVKEIKKYYSLAVDDNQASIHIYGDIVSWEWLESDVSSYTLAKEIEALDVDVINVYINSYGGEVAEGLAIYNNLRRHKAKVKTYCDGFACSAASVVFMAGDERIMSNASLLMIHNAWLYTAGDSKQLRKDADNLEIITQASINAYMNHTNITEEELKEMLDAETWLSPTEALEMGFATTVISENTKGASQNYRKRIAEMILKQQQNTEPPEPDPDPEPEPEPKQNKPKNLMAALFR